MSTTLPKTALTFLAASMLSLQAGASTDTGVSDLPEQWQTFITEQQLPVHSVFEVSDNISGLLLSWEGQTETLYLLHEEGLVMAGSLISAQGDNVTEQHEVEYFWGDMLNDVISSLDEDSSLWIARGDDDAPYIYTFDDLNCPFCNQQYNNIESLVESGQLQVRHVLVGMLQEDSASLAAKVLNSDDPAALLSEYQARFGDPAGKRLINEAEPSVSEDPRVSEAQALMSKAGLNGTPGTLVPQDGRGPVRFSGLTSPEVLMDAVNPQR